MSNSAVVRAPGRSTPVAIQVLRGAAYVVVILSVLLGAAVALRPTPGEIDGPHWLRLIGFIAVAALVGSTSWWLSRWARRPWWLLPAGTIVLLATIVPAAKPFSLSEDASASCVPVLDAWHAAVPRPSASDMAVFQSTWTVPVAIDLRDPSKRAAFARDQARIRATPQYERASRYVAWTFGQGPCVPQSRRYLLVSGAALCTGLVAIAIAVRRRRSTTGSGAAA